MSEPDSPPPEPLDLDRPSLPPIREFNDRGTLWLLEDPRNVCDLLRILEPELAERLDFVRAQRINRSFIPADLQKQESDLIFLVPVRHESGQRDREVWVYLLLEHQSVHDPLMGLRLYLYMGQLWDSQRREWDDQSAPTVERRLRPIVPLVFYTGEETWSTPIGLAHLMDLPAELERFVPQWETLLLSLHQTPPETLTRFASAVGYALQVLQAETAPLAEMERVLTEAMAALEGLTEEQVGQWLRAAWYLLLFAYHRRGERELIDFIVDQTKQSRFRQRTEVREMGLTVAQQLETQATRKALTTVLTARFGAVPTAIERAVATADAETIETWLRRAATAATLDEVGILPQDSSG